MFHGEELRLSLLRHKSIQTSIISSNMFSIARNIASSKSSLQGLLSFCLPVCLRVSRVILWNVGHTQHNRPYGRRISYILCVFWALPSSSLFSNRFQNADRVTLAKTCCSTYRLSTNIVFQFSQSLIRFLMVKTSQLNARLEDFFRFLLIF